MLFIDKNYIINFIGENRIRIYHPFYRRNALVSANFTRFIDPLTRGIDEAHLLSMMTEEPGDYYYADATEFNLWQCMYNNADLMAERPEEQPMKPVGGKELIGKLVDIKVLTYEKSPQYDFAKKNPLDRFSGNINERIATESLYRKLPINEWWAGQKFDEEGSHIKDTPYKYIQSSFLEDYFRNNLPGKEVLEVGCGTGYYVSRMADYANRVYGVDYESKYINLARSRVANKKNVNLIVKDISESLLEDNFGGKTFDYIFMIDIFLFLFDRRFQRKLFENRERILKQIGGLLKAGGILVIMDPHLFWLVPHFGASEHPFGVVTEYKEKFFGVTPTLEEMSELFFKSGLAIRRIMEPSVDEEFKLKNTADYNFFRQFPQWIVLELINAGRAL